MKKDSKDREVVSPASTDLGESAKESLPHRPDGNKGQDSSARASSTQEQPEDKLMVKQYQRPWIVRRLLALILGAMLGTIAALMAIGLEWVAWKLGFVLSGHARWIFFFTAFGVLIAAETFRALYVAVVILMAIGLELVPLQFGFKFTSNWITKFILLSASWIILQAAKTFRNIFYGNEKR